MTDRYNFKGAPLAHELGPSSLPLNPGVEDIAQILANHPHHIAVQMLAEVVHNYLAKLLAEVEKAREYADELSDYPRRLEASLEFNSPVERPKAYAAC